MPRDQDRSGENRTGLSLPLSSLTPASTLSFRNSLPTWTVLRDFPTLPSAVSHQPLPLPPRTHALLRTTHTHALMTNNSNFAAKHSQNASGSPLPPKSKFAPPPMSVAVLAIQMLLTALWSNSMTKITTTHYHQGPALLLQSVTNKPQEVSARRQFRTYRPVPIRSLLLLIQRYLLPTLSPQTRRRMQTFRLSLSKMVMRSCPHPSHLLPLVLVLRTLPCLSSQFLVVHVQQENSYFILGTLGPPLSLSYRHLRFRVEESKEDLSFLHPRSQAAVAIHSDTSYEEETTRPTFFSLYLANFTSSIRHSSFRGQVSFRDCPYCHFCQGNGHL